MPSIAIIGLGYVGLPLGVALARHGHHGYDCDPFASERLRAGRDGTGEAGASRALAVSMLRSPTIRPNLPATRSSSSACRRRPRPRVPDLSAVRAACRTTGPFGCAGVPLWSSRAPSIRERPRQVAGPTLPESSGLRAGVRSILPWPYSPERMNPGDRAHTPRAGIPEVVAGQTPLLVEAAPGFELYGRLNGWPGPSRADIRTAEAAKAIEPHRPRHQHRLHRTRSR